ncbi:MAG TPA: DUF692 family protein [Herpetosiphonaceae bacterium]
MPYAASFSAEVSTRPGLAFTYEGNDPALLERVLPLVDYIEVTPDTIAEMRDDGVALHAPTIAELQNIGSDAKIIVHGVGLSIGSYDGYSRQYIRLLDEIMSKLDVAWHSEHLAYTMVDGQNLGTMLALPKTDEVLDMICQRVGELQARYTVPFLLENVVHVLPELPGDYSDAAFLNALVARTGCGLILDVYNLECDARNYGFDIPAFLAELNLAAVRELHVAGGIEHKGFQLDVHSRLPQPSTVALAQQVTRMAHGSVKAVTYEVLREAVPVLGHDAITDELARLGKRLDQIVWN